MKDHFLHVYLCPGCNEEIHPIEARLLGFERFAQGLFAVYLARLSIKEPLKGVEIEGSHQEGKKENSRQATYQDQAKECWSAFPTLQFSPPIQRRR